MAVLVTGAAGFVALNVVEHLLSAGRQVVGLDRIPLPKRAVRDFPALPGHLTMIGGSILSDADLSRALTMRPIEAVIHCAIITAGSQREIADPGSIVAVNINGAVATLMAAVRHGVGRHGRGFVTANPSHAVWTNEVRRRVHPGPHRGHPKRCIHRRSARDRV